MLFIGGKMYQVSMKNESRYSIINFLLSFRSGLPYGFSDFLERGLNVLRETTNVNIDAVIKIVHPF
jgi:hypothetical protein